MAISCLFSKAPLELVKMDVHDMDPTSVSVTCNVHQLCVHSTSEDGANLAARWKKVATCKDAAKQNAKSSIIFLEKY